MFSSSKRSFGGEFSETGAPTYRYVVGQGVIIRNELETLQYSWSHSSVFGLEK